MKVFKKSLFSIFLIVITCCISVQGKSIQGKKEFSFVKVDTLLYMKVAEQAYSKNIVKLYKQYKDANDTIYYELAKITFFNYLNELKKDAEEEKNKEKIIITQLRTDSIRLCSEMKSLADTLSSKNAIILSKNAVIFSRDSIIQVYNNSIIPNLRNNISEQTDKITRADKILTALTGNFDEDYKNYQTSGLDNISSNDIIVTINKVSQVIEFVPEYQAKIKKLEAFQKVLSVYQSGKDKLKIQYNKKEIKPLIDILDRDTTMLFSDIQKKQMEILAANLSKYERYSDCLYRLINEINQLEDFSGRLLDEKKETAIERIKEMVFAVTEQKQKLSFGSEFEYLNAILNDFIKIVKNNPNDHEAFNKLLEKIN